MSDGLRLVEGIGSPDSSEVGGVEQWAAPYTVRFKVGDDGARNFSATFFQPYSRQAVLESVYRPLENVVPGQSEQRIETGLKAMTYPSYYESKKSRRAAILGGQALATQLHNTRDLLKSVRHSDDFEQVRLRANLFERSEIEARTYRRIAGLKPSEIGRLCIDYDVALNELALWRAKKGNRVNQFVDFSNRPDVFDLDKLVGNIIEGNYAEKTRLPGGWPVLVDNAQLPEQLRAPGMIELKRRLPLRPAEEFGERWEFIARLEGRPKHVVYPTVSWSVLPTAGLSDRPQLNFRQPRPAYNSLRHEVEHYNPLLGAVMLSSMVAPEVLECEFRARFNNRRRFWSPPLPDRAAPARLLELVHAPKVMEQLVNVELFGELRQVGEGLDGEI